MFGYVDKYRLDFIVENCDIMIAMLIPFTIVHPKCQQLIEEICDIVQKDLSLTIRINFLSIYIHVYLNETADVHQKCMKFLTENTRLSLNLLLKSNIKVFQFALLTATIQFI